MADIKIYKLNLENEFRMFVGENCDSVFVKLVDGLAEMFGTELEKDKNYNIPTGSSISIFSWHGCTLKVLGTPTRAYVATETPMIIYVTLHTMFEEMRVNADKENRRGPVALFVGPPDSGKSTLCRLMLNYAARLGRRPFLIDLDVGQNALSIPGTINVLNVSKPADIVDGFDQDAVQAYQFGYKNPGQLLALYFLLIKKIGKVLRTRIRQSNKNSRSSGAIINTCGWTRGQGYNAITLAAASFEIDVIVVLEEERLYLQLQKDMPECVKVIFIPRMGGIIERSRSIRLQSRANRVREYFYGFSHPLCPHTLTINFQDVKILQVLKIQNADEAEITANVSMDDIWISPVEFGNHLKNKVLALSSADSMSDDIVLTNVLGFICIVDIDTNSEDMKILSPQPGPLPKNILIMGEIELTEKRIIC